MPPSCHYCSDGTEGGGTVSEIDELREGEAKSWFIKELGGGGVEWIRGSCFFSPDKVSAWDYQCRNPDLAHPCEHVHTHGNTYLYTTHQCASFDM